MDYYRYGNIPHENIRLLRIVPQDSIYEDSLYVIEEYAPGEVKFDALSYTWGLSTYNHICSLCSCQPINGAQLWLSGL